MRKLLFAAALIEPIGEQLNCSLNVVCAGDDGLCRYSSMERQTTERSPAVNISPLSATSSSHQRKRSLVVNDELEEELKKELVTLDDQIASLKEKLGKAAMVQSQKILADVIDSSIQQLQNLDPHLTL